jgi:hypothetical protein
LFKPVSFYRQISPSNNNGCLDYVRMGASEITGTPVASKVLRNACARQVGSPRDASKLVVLPKNHKLFENMRQSDLARRALISTKMVFPRERTNISEPWFPATRLSARRSSRGRANQTKASRAATDVDDDQTTFSLAARVVILKVNRDDCVWVSCRSRAWKCALWKIR